MTSRVAFAEREKERASEPVALESGALEISSWDRRGIGGAPLMVGQAERRMPGACQALAGPYFRCARGIEPGEVCCVTAVCEKARGQYERPLICPKYVHAG